MRVAAPVCHGSFVGVPFVSRELVHELSLMVNVPSTKRQSLTCHSNQGAELNCSKERAAAKGRSAP